MKIDVIKLGYIKVNCYLLSSDNCAIVIDPGYDSQEVTSFLNDNKDKERLILLTHGHFDHIGGAEKLRDDTGVKIAIGVNENEALSDDKLSLNAKFHTHIKHFSADILLNDNEEYKIGDLTFKTIETPGHTRGGVSYLFDNKLFSGDTLFLESIGRTDFYGGDLYLLKDSAKKLLTLPDETDVFPGHGDITKIGHEKKYNPYL